MFSCYLHGWNHIINPCPLCPASHQIVTSDSTEMVPQGNPETGLGERYEAYRYRRIHNAVVQMGGMANFTHWVNRHAKNYFNSLELEREQANKLASTLEKISLWLNSDKEYSCGCDPEVGFVCAPCAAALSANDAIHEFNLYKKSQDEL